MAEGLIHEQVDSAAAECDAAAADDADADDDAIAAVDGVYC